jgi:hypothetical protein
MLSEPKCGCCGCDVRNILRHGGLRPTGITIDVWLNTLRYVAENEERGGYDGFGPTTITPVTATWSRDGATRPNVEEVFGGSVSLDLQASRITAPASYRPIRPLIVTSDYVYEAGDPPTGDDLEATVEVTLHGDVTATVTAELVERELPEDFADPFIIELDTETLPLSNADGRPLVDVTAYPQTITGVSTSGTRFLSNWFDDIYVRTLYQIPLQCVVVDALFRFGGSAPPDPVVLPAAAQAFYDLPEPSARPAAFEDEIFPIRPGTQLSQFVEFARDGIQDFVIYCEHMSLYRFAESTVESHNGWTVEEPRLAPVFEAEDPVPPAPPVVGFDARIVLSLGDVERLVMPKDARTTPAMPVTLQCLPDPQDPEDKEERPEQGLFTAWVDRGRRVDITSSSPFPIEVINGTEILGVNFEFGRPSRARPGFTNTTVRQFRGLQLKVYRDGELVLDKTRPTIEESREATAEDGSYLVVEKVSEESDSEWTGNGPDVRTRAVRFLKNFASVVVDRVPPVVGFSLCDDIFNGDDFSTFARWTAGTEPVGLRSSPTSSTYDFSLSVNSSAVPVSQQIDELPESLTTIPVPAEYYLSSAEQRLSRLRTLGDPRSVLETKDGRTTLKVGSHELQWGVTNDGFSDQAGNLSLRTPKFTVTSHPEPTPPRARGAKPKLEDPGWQTIPYYRARLDSEPVVSLRLTFDRKIDPAGVDASQLTLTCDGETVEGFQFEPVDDGSFAWTVILDGVEQPQRTFWTLEYNPGGAVFTDDAADTGDGPPLDEDGIPYDPEPCVLATRVSWLMADMNGYHRLIDVSATPSPPQIGRVVSISETLPFDLSKADSLVKTEGGMYLPATLGRFSPGIADESFIPSVPRTEIEDRSEPPAAWPGDEPEVRPEDEPVCSYFGLTTTIDPCTPAEVSACAAPSEHQKHASAIRTDRDIESLEVQVMIYGNPSGEPSVLDNAVFPNAPVPFLLFGTAVDFSVNDFRRRAGVVSDVLDGDWVPPVLMAKGEPYVFTTDLDGFDTSQNVWHCLEEQRGEAMGLLPASSRRFGKALGDRPIVCEDEQRYVDVRYFTPVVYDLSEADVLALESLPYEGNILRGGEVIQGPVDPVLPGDRYPFNIAPSLAGRYIPWWRYRKRPQAFPDDWIVDRGFGDGQYHAIADGRLTQDGFQGTLSAFRFCRQFPALKTTVLSELLLNLSARMAVRVEIDYETRKIIPAGFTDAPHNPCDGLNSYEEMISRPGAVGPQLQDEQGNPSLFIAILGNEEPYEYETFGLFQSNLTGWGNIDDTELLAERTVTHRFLADVEYQVVLSRDQEEALANGEEIMVPVKQQRLFLFDREDEGQFVNVFLKIKANFAD